MTAGEVIGQRSNVRVAEALVQRAGARLNDETQRNTFGDTRKIRSSANTINSVPIPLPRKRGLTATVWRYPTNAPVTHRITNPRVRHRAPRHTHHASDRADRQRCVVVASERRPRLGRRHDSCTCVEVCFEWPVLSSPLAQTRAALPPSEDAASRIPCVVLSVELGEKGKVAVAASAPRDLGRVFFLSSTPCPRDIFRVCVCCVLPGIHSLSEHLCRYFEELGFDTVPCVGISEAMDLVPIHEADAVICDYDLLASVPIERWEQDEVSPPRPSSR